MAKKKRKTKFPAVGGWRAGLTTEQALDHLHQNMTAKFDNLNRIILPLSDRIRLIEALAKLLRDLGEERQ